MESSLIYANNLRHMDVNRKEMQILWKQKLIIEALSWVVEWWLSGFQEGLWVLQLLLLILRHITTNKLASWASMRVK